MADTEQLLQDEDDTVEFGAEYEPKAKFKHPVAVAFHIIFKIAAFVAFILCEYISSGFVLNFIVIILFLILDFWTTKNVSGRLLVGYRWWNYIDDDGKSHWMFESKQGQQRKAINVAESRLFWVSMFIAQLLWILMIFLFLLRIKWLVLIIIANILNGANLYGYIRCKTGTGKSVKDYATGMVSRQMFSSAFSMFRRGQQSQAGSTETNNIV